ncbi:MAG: hypothetical protein FJZ57_03275 [Chlamydiae bacterium]|nr:hypothetical protein [Chlamydiota bacterium]
MLTGYMAPEGLEHLIEKQLTNIVDKIGRLFIAEGPTQNILFVQNIWYDLKKIEFTSIGDAAKQLKTLGKLWSLYPVLSVRRASLIADKLSYFKSKLIPFPSSLPTSPLGAWTLKNENILYASAKTSSPFAQGEVYFQESKEPPSRAYLKLWEALTLLETRPSLNQVCLEIGACPGSWTWALQKMAKKVIAVDRAPIVDSISNLDGVVFLKKDAFSLLPEDYKDVDWVFSDVICYPEKLLEWVLKWLQVNPKLNFVCTLKFQGSCDYRIVEEFLKIPNSKIFHLFNNKHELTWALVH